MRRSGPTRAHQFVIVSEDADYSDLGLLQGVPPYVIWLRLGNCTTAQIESALRAHHTAIMRLGERGENTILIIM
jgi:predicted nuclease of predicted toxin-antitoxin system